MSIQFFIGFSLEIYTICLLLIIFIMNESYRVEVRVDRFGRLADGGAGIKNSSWDLGVVFFFDSHLSSDVGASEDFSGWPSISSSSGPSRSSSSSLYSSSSDEESIFFFGVLPFFFWDFSVFFPIPKTF